MSSCPQCGNEIKEPFGIVQCSNCKTMLIADFDGNLKISTEDSSAVSDVLEVPAQSLPEAPFQANENNVTPEWDFEQPQIEVPAIETAEALSPEKELTSTLNPQIQEIQEFANADVSSAREGVLYYNLEISGIDSQDLKEAIIDSLTDSRLVLNVPVLVKSITNGTLKISKLNAIKASIIVTRLKEYPLEISWTQMSLLDPGAKIENNP